MALVPGDHIGNAAQSMFNVVRDESDRDFRLEIIECLKTRICLRCGGIKLKGWQHGVNDGCICISEYPSIKLIIKGS